MLPSTGKLLALGAALTWIGLAALAPAETLPVPDRLVVLTFDDANLTDLTFVAPCFRATASGPRSSSPRDSSPTGRTT